jgi:hypothetical protein
MKIKLALATVIATLLLSACAGMGSPAAPATSVALLEPADGAVVATKFKVKFGVKGMEVRPAGDIVPNTGHHHLLIDLGSLPAGEAIPFTPKHLHFGKGQTEAEVELPPGNYKITAQFANGAHQSYGQGMSKTISITVR